MTDTVQSFDYDHELRVMALQDRLRKKIPRELREVDVPGKSFFMLSFAELFATRRAEQLPADVHTLWQALNDLELQPIMTPGGYPYASPPAVIDELCAKCNDAVQKHGRESAKHDAARKALHATMYAGMTAEQYSEWRVEQRRDAANIGF